MIKEKIASIEELKGGEILRLIIDFIHRLIIHHGIWYAEVQHQFGREKALELLNTVYPQSLGIQIRRLGKVLGFETKNDIPEPLLNLPDETINRLKEAVATNWLANDGVWFQAVEFSRGLADAKQCNDSCWGYFSPFEAWSIKRFLGLDDNSGLGGLKKALPFRLYASINQQSISEETPTSFVFKMNECRVQAARKRKGLPDYPCKSAGLVEYPMFAESIDSRITTECIGCPPDDHPPDWYCAWRFTIEE